MISLTPAQADCVRIVGELTDALGRPPSVREVAHELDRGAKSAFDLIERCRERGWIGEGMALRRRLPVPPDCDVEITETGAAYCGAASAAGAGHRGEAGDFMM